MTSETEKKPEEKSDGADILMAAGSAADGISLPISLVLIAVVGTGIAGYYGVRWLRRRRRARSASVGASHEPDAQ